MGRSLGTSYPKTYNPTLGDLERLRRSRGTQGREEGWDARESRSKQRRGRKEEEG